MLKMGLAFLHRGMTKKGKSDFLRDHQT